MNVCEDKSEFRYTYSAKEQEEIKRIRQKYQPQETDKLQRLRRLDENVTKKATMVSLAAGIIGALIMGSGMSLAMTDFGKVFGLQATEGMIIGIVIGVFGMAVLGLAYPIYLRIAKKEREKVASEVLKLTDELLK